MSIVLSGKRVDSKKEKELTQKVCVFFTGKPKNEERFTHDLV